MTASDPTVGSIPACAGEPASSSALPSLRTVYPRVCGGTWQPISLKPLVKGLSPRVRGNLFVEAHIAFDERSIPACAGEPLPLSSSHRNARVYPRVCGGTTVAFDRFALLNGLSPRVRGNLAQWPWS